MIRIIITAVKEMGSLIVLPLISNSIEQSLHRRKSRTQQNMNNTPEAKMAILGLIKELLPRKEVVPSKLTFFKDLDNNEQLISTIVIQATDIIESIRDFVDCIEEVDSYMSSFTEQLGEISIATKTKVINSIIADSLLLGGYGYDVRVKSLES